ncbi:unnamed protein product [Sphagnum jensenii]|uniref:Hexosyltransferase n=1 Tax=Sphagnum jensenii TaxID=128206 RepID=A0ABP0XBT4_9BRYO
MPIFMSMQFPQEERFSMEEEEVSPATVNQRCGQTKSSEMEARRIVCFLLVPLLLLFSLLFQRRECLLGCVSLLGCCSSREKILLSKTACHPKMINSSSRRRKKHKVLGVVGIQTGFDSGLRRKALRETWFPSTPEGILRLERATGLAFRFVIGHSVDVWKMRALEEEITQHNDFIRIDIDESYQNLNLKTLAFFKAAYMLFDADFYVKADDDIYLRPDRLATLLAKERPSPRTYLGCMKKGPVITDAKFKWFEPNGYMLGSEYFLHAYGPIYALSAEVVASLSAARNNSLRMFMNEDVTIGVWMLAMDVTHEDNRALCDPQCHPNSIAVWDLPKCSGLCHPTEQLSILHQDPMCSTSPTLPQD